MTSQCLTTFLEINSRKREGIEEDSIQELDLDKKSDPRNPNQMGRY